MREKVKDNDIIPIKGFMLDMNFDDYRELIVYAAIYAWTQSRGCCYYREQWFAEWLKSDASDVREVFAKLVNKGYISPAKPAPNPYLWGVGFVAGRALESGDGK